MLKINRLLLVVSLFLFIFCIGSCGGGGGGTTGGGTTDTTAPSNASVSINSGAVSTASTAVTLSISAMDNEGVVGYYASETSTTPSASASGWTSVTSATSYSANVSFTLSSGDGTKTVYVWFKDAAGNVSASASDSIILSAAESDYQFVTKWGSIGSGDGQFGVAPIGIAVDSLGYIYVGDGGELVSACYSLGIAHPPGYPIFDMFGKLFIILILNLKLN